MDLRKLFKSIPLLFTIASYSIIPFGFGCSKNRTIIFPKTFEMVLEDFQRKFSSAESVLQMSFAETLTICLVPLKSKDLNLFATTINRPESFSATFYISKEFNVPFPFAFFARDFLEADCSKNRCIIKDNIINQEIQTSIQEIQDGYLLQNTKIHSSIGDISITSYISPSSQIVSDVKALTPKSEEIFSFALSYYYDPTTTIESILTYNGTSCRSKVVIYDEKTRHVSISVLRAKEWNEFSGIISIKDNCKQKPYANLSSAKSQIFLDGKQCDSVFISSNVELLYDLIRRIEENTHTSKWIGILEKLSERFSIFTDELNFLKFTYLLKDFFNKNFSFSLIFDDKDKVNESLSVVEALRTYIKSINVAFPKNAKIYISDSSYLEVSTQINRASLYFFDIYLDYLSFILNYIKSLDNNIPQSEKNSILNEFRRRELSLGEKLRFVVLGLKSSQNFLKTSDLEARRESYNYLYSVILKFLNFPHVLKDWRSGLFHYSDGTLIIDTGKEKTSFFIPHRQDYVDLITSNIDGFLEQKDLSDFLSSVNSLIKAIYTAARDKSPKFIYFFLDGLSKKWEYNAYSINLKELFFAELREIIPTWVQVGERYNFAIEWDCPSAYDPSKPLSALYSFPESITCEGTLQDMAHFSDYRGFGEAGKWGEGGSYDNGNHFFPDGFGGADNRKTRFPYIFFKDPSFGGSLKIRIDIIAGTECGGFVGFGFFSPTGYKGVCEVNLLTSFLMSE